MMGMTSYVDWHSPANVAWFFVAWPGGRCHVGFLVAYGASSRAMKISTI
jgi:hypothetical protein